LSLEAPEICIEVLSPSNSQLEMVEKRALYFEAGAAEVWTCDLDDSMTFHVGHNAPQAETSDAGYPSTVHNCAAPKAGPLLRLLFLRFGEVSPDAGRELCLFLKLQ
jgi:hypothetical protein